MNITIDFLCPRDVTAIRQLAESIWPIAYRDLLSEDQIRYMIEQRYDPEVLLEQMAAGDLFLGARRDRWCGYAHVYALGLGLFKLDKLYVDVDHQGQGIGRQLLERVFSEVILAGGVELTLRVNRLNLHAIKVYERNGFEITGTDKVAIGGGFFMDDYVMTCSLDEKKGFDALSE